MRNGIHIDDSAERSRKNMWTPRGPVCEEVNGSGRNERATLLLLKA